MNVYFCPFTEKGKMEKYLRFMLIPLWAFFNYPNALGISFYLKEWF